MRAAETPLPARTLELTSAPTILLKGSHVSGKAPKLSVCQCVYVSKGPIYTCADACVSVSVSVSVSVCQPAFLSVFVYVHAPYDPRA